MTREEALEIVRNIPQTDKEKEALETLVPELKESEDERIRKELLDAVDKARVFDIDKDVADRWTAWLEKQKEQKPYQEVLSDSENRMLDYHASLVRGEERKPFAHENDFVSKPKGYVENAAHNYAMNFGDKGSELYIEIFDAYKAGAYYAELRHQPAEWSEGDKEMLERCVSKMANIIPVPGKHGVADMSFEKHTDEELVIWLKSLSERFNLQPKQEWSEEDSKRYVSIGTTLETSVVLSKEDYDANMAWLRELVNAKKYSDPRPSWKPSEEQMEALNAVANEGVLLDLFNDLLKLF